MDDSLDEVLWTKSCDIGSFGGLPALRLISPNSGRSPSPILDRFDSTEEVHVQTPVKESTHITNEEISDYFVPLQHINSQISPPDDSFTGVTNLETIFEDVFLNTPPRRHKKLGNLSECGKENSPCMDETLTKRSSAQELGRFRSFKYKTTEVHSTMNGSYSNNSEHPN